MCIEGRKGIKVDAKKFAEVFMASQPWPEIRHWKRYDWEIVHDVRVIDLEPCTRQDYDLDPDLSEEEAKENIERMDRIIALLQEGRELWPIVMGLDCTILDGYHRLAAAAELGIEMIDVIYPI